MAIVGYRDTVTRNIAKGTFTPGAQQTVPTSIQMQARAQIAVLDRTKSLDELRRKFSVEKLGKERKGEYLLGINKEFGICFFWDEANKNAEEVEIVNLKTAAISLVNWPK